MEQQQYSIEQILQAKINQKAQKKVGELSALLFEAEAKAELLQEFYNNATKELEELKNQVPDENQKKNDTPIKETENTPPLISVKSEDTRDWFDINDQ